MSSRRKKIITTTTAIVLILALGLAGTFAASSSGDSPGNIEGQVETSIFLHDDFSKTWDGDVMDRDVYVENTGDTSLYVRMRLDEFMTYGGKKLVGGDRDQKSTWKPHVPAGTNPAECGTEIHDYFTIQMGNDTGVKYKPKTKNAYDPAITEAEKTKTTSAAEIVLMEDYLNAEEKPDACWVLDTADGYAYWHQQLPKGKATGLILNSITNTGLIDESYYYGINAKAEAVTEMDLNAWLNGRPPKDSEAGEAFDQASTDAIRFLKNLSPKYIEITEEMAANGAGDYDGDNDGYLTKQENAEYEAEKGVTSTPKPDPEPTPEPEISTNTTNFPDSTLRNEVQAKDTNNDGKLSKEEIEAVTSLDLSGKGVTDFKGLEHFTELTDLNVSNNDLTEVNFLSKTPKLTTLNASGNHLKSLDVSSISGLTSVTAENQTVEEAVTYDAENNTYKSSAGEYATGTTFASGDVTLNADGSVSVANMADGKTSNFSVPVTLAARGVNEVSGTITFKTKTEGWVTINSTNFPNAALRTAVQTKDTNSDGKLSEAEVKAATSLNLSGKTITDYKGLELLTSLTDLNVSNSNLTEVTFLSKTPELTKLNVSNNKLTSIDVSSAPKLTTLTADNQAVTTVLTYSEATNTYNSAASAYKGGTTFTGTDVKLQGDGSIRVSNMAENKKNAYSYPVTVKGGSASVSGTVTLTTNTSNWKAVNSTTFPASAFLNVAKTKDLNADNRLSEEEVYQVTSLNLSGKGISNFTGLEVFNKLETLDVSNSSLTTVNFLSRTPNLMSLNVSNNNLTSLSLAKGALTKVLEAVAEDRAATQLTYVNCSNNKLTSLDLSSAPGLETLDCKNNQLTKLDISRNAALGNIIADGQTKTVNVAFDKTAWKYKGGNNLFTTGTTFGASDASYDSATGGLTMDALTDGKTSTYSLPLKYNNSQKGSLSGTITFTGTIYVPTVKEKVAHTPTGGTVTIANKDGSTTEWIVYNKTADEADLITKDMVTKRHYHESNPYPGWPDSDIRKWLNDGTAGYKSQLSDEMKAAIKPQNLTTASAFDNWEITQNSTDEIYLLTETGEGSGTVGKDIGASVVLTTEQLKCNFKAADGQSINVCWLRSPYANVNSAVYVYNVSGLFEVTGKVPQNGGVRPALTINLL